MCCSNTSAMAFIAYSPSSGYRETIRLDALNSPEARASRSTSVRVFRKRSTRSQSYSLGSIGSTGFSPQSLKRRSTALFTFGNFSSIIVLSSPTINFNYIINHSFRSGRSRGQFFTDIFSDEVDPIGGPGDQPSPVSRRHRLGRFVRPLYAEHCRSGTLAGTVVERRRRVGSSGGFSSVLRTNPSDRRQGDKFEAASASPANDLSPGRFIEPGFSCFRTFVLGTCRSRPPA